MEPGDLDLSVMPREIKPKKKLGIGGHYPGAFMVGFADGYVWFIKDSVPFETLEKFFTLESAKKYDREKELGKFRIEQIERFEDWLQRK